MSDVDLDLEDAGSGTTLVIDSLDAIKVFGFDLEITNADGTVQIIANGLVDFVAGVFSIETAEGKVDILSLVDSNKSAVENLNSIFLEDLIQTASEEETDSTEDALLDQLNQTDSKLKENQELLAQKAADIAQIEKKLIEEKERSDKLQEQIEAQSSQSEQSISEAKNAIDEASQQETLNTLSEAGEPATENPAEIKKVTAVVKAAIESTVSDEPTSEQVVAVVEEPVALESLSFTLANTSDSGVKSDFITNVNNASSGSILKFEGISDPNVTIELIIDGNTFTTVADATGVWSVNASNVLNDGNYTVDVTAQGTGGASLSLSNTLTIDTVAPDPPSVSLANPADSGVLGDDVTNLLPVFNGLAELGSTVLLTLNNIAYLAEVDDNGAWEITTQALSNGSYSYNVTAQDIAGNISLPTTNNIVIDTENNFSGGVDEGSNSGDVNDELTNIPNPAFSGAGEANSSVTLRVQLGAGITELYTSVVDENGLWRIDAITPLEQDGEYQYTLESVDVAGNEAVLSQRFLLDTVAPDFSGGLLSDSDSGQSTSDGITNINTPTFGGKGEANATVLLTFASGASFTSVVDDEGNWQIAFTTPLADGDYVYTLSSADAADNITTLAPATLTIDILEGVVTGGLAASSDTGTSDSDGITNQLAPEFAGTGNVGAVITLDIDANQYSATVDSNGQWSILVPTEAPLSAGLQSYVIKAVTIAGNEASLNGEITVIPSIEKAVTVSLVTADDSGTFNNDNITQVTAPLFTGTGGVDNEVVLTITSEQGASQTFRATVDANNLWSVRTTPTGGKLDDGAYTYTATSTDIAGNTSTTPLGNMIIDTETPTLLGGLSTDSDTGGLDNDGITNDTQPVFEGTSDAGAVVELLINNRSYSVTVSDDETWSLPVVDVLSDATYNYTLNATDVAGNQTTEAGTVTIDTLAPVFSGMVQTDSGQSASDGITNISAAIFVGTGEANASVLLTFTNGLSYTGIVDGTGSWQIVLPNPLADGDFTYTLSSEDVAGNTTTLAPATLTIDITPPSLSWGLRPDSDTGALDNDDITNNTQPVFEGTSEAGAVVELLINNRSYSVTVGDDEIWSLPVVDALSDATYNYTLNATDVAGNQTTEAGSVTIDTTPPTLLGGLNTDSDSGTLDNDGITNNTLPVFEGSSDAGAVVELSLNNVTYSATVGIDGKWSIPVSDTLSDDSYAYTLSATDVAGNQATEAGSITVDTQLPALSGGLWAANDSGKLDSDGITNITTSTFLGTGEVNAPVFLTFDNGNSYAAIVDAVGNWQIALPSALADGDYTYTLSSEDVAGNTTTLAPATLTIDTVMPLLSGGLDESSDTGSSNTDGITNSVNPLFSGTGEAGVVITLEIDANQYSATVDSTGQWTLAVTTDLFAGRVAYVLKATDIAGNEASVNGNFTLIPIIETPVTVRLAQSADSGTFNNDNITNSESLVFTGTGGVDDEVILTIISELGGSQTYPVTVGANKTWSIDSVSTLADGVYTYTAASTDLAGNASTTEAVSFTIDSVNIFSGGLDDTGNSGDVTDVITKIPNPAFSGLGEAGASVKLTVTLANGSTIVSNETVDVNGDWKIDPIAPLSPDGVYAYTLESVDIAGNLITLNQSLTLDTLAPAFAGGLLTDTDTGSSDTDGITSNQTPTFGGTGEANDVVSLTFTGGVTYTAVVNTDNSWELILPTTLADGEYEYALSSTDAADNVTTLDPAVPPPKLIIDTSTPTPTGGLIHDIVNDTGTVQDDNVTNNASPDFEGTAEVNATITLTVTDSGGNEFEYEATASDITPDDDNDNGVWSITHTDVFAEGQVSYTIKSVDVAGNIENTTGTFELIRTIEPVTVALLSDNGTDIDVDNITNMGRPHFAGVGGEGDKIELTITNQVGAPIPQVFTATVQDDDTWSIELSDVLDLDLDSGDYTYAVKSTDIAGNTDDVSAVDFTVDTIAPGITGGLDVDSHTGGLDSDDVPLHVGFTKQTSPVFSGTSEAEAVVTLTIDGKDYSVTVGGSGSNESWSITVADTLLEGEHNYSLSAMDVAGNIDTLTDTITVDTTEPDIQGGVSSVTLEDTGLFQDDGVTSNTTPLFAGTGEVGAKVELIFTATDPSAFVVSSTRHDYSVEVDGDGNWEINLEGALAEGLHAYTLSGTDAAGNTQTLSTAYVTIDTDAILTVSGLTNTTNSYNPALSVGPVDQKTNHIQPVIQGSSEANAVITLTFFKDLVAVPSGDFSATVIANGDWTADVSSLAEGDYTYTVKSVDRAGNETLVENQVLTIDRSNTFTGGLTQDRTNDTGTFENDGKTNNQSPEFSGTGETGALITLTTTDVNATISTYTTTVTDSTWSIQLPSATALLLPEGKVDYTLDSVDIAGNAATQQTGNIEIILSIEQVTVVLGTLSDSGVSDNITNEKRPSFVATAGEGDDLEFTITNSSGDVQTFTQTVTSTTAGVVTYTILMDSELDDGEYTYTATSSDAIGNVSTTDPVSVIMTIDTAIPVLSAGLDSDDSGHSDNDGVTNTQPTFGGNINEAAQITLTINNQTYTDTVSGSGAWSIPVTNALDNGTYAYITNATDVAGNQSEDVAGSITIDASLPIVTASLDTDSGLNTADGITNLNTPSFSGTVSESVHTLTLTINSVTHSVNVNASANPDGDFPWSFVHPTALPDGPYTYMLTATDAAGNVGTDTGNITVDTVNTSLTDSDTNFAVKYGDFAAVVDGNPENNNAAAQVGEVARVLGADPSFFNIGDIGGSIFVGGNTVVFSGNDIQFKNTDIITLTVGSESFTASPVGGVWNITATPTALEAVQGDTAGYSLTMTDLAGNNDTITGTFIVDLTFPTNTTVTLNENGGATDSEDDVTNTPEFFGSTTADLNVRLALTYDGASSDPNLIYQDTFDGVTDGTTGAYSFTPDLTGWADGVYNYTVLFVNKAGEQTLSTEHTFTLDTVTTGTIGLADNDDNTVTADANLTKSDTPMFAGTLEAGAAVSITFFDSNQDMIGTPQDGLLNADGTEWNLTYPTVLDDATYTAQATVTDTAGNTFSETITFSVDVVAPTIAPSILLDDTTNSGATVDTITNATSLTFGGSAPANETLDLRDTNSDLIQTVAVNSSGVWSATLTGYGEGDHTFSVVYYDESGNASPIDEITVTIDQTAMTPFYAGFKDNAQDLVGFITGDFRSQLSQGTSVKGINAEEGVTVTLVIKGVTDISYDETLTTTVDTDGNYELLLPDGLDQGDYTLKLTAVDAAGNVAERDLESLFIGLTLTGGLDVDSDLGALDNDGITSDTSPTFTGTVDAGATVSIYLNNNPVAVGTATGDSDGNWTYTSGNLADGPQAVRFSATDGTNNTEDLSDDINLSLVIDSEADLIVTGLSDATDTGTDDDWETAEQNVTFEGTDTPGAIITLSIDDKEFSSTANGQGNWSISPDELPFDDYAYTVTSLDLAGNTSTIVSNQDLRIAYESEGITAGLDSGDDQDALPYDSSTQGDNITSNTAPVISGAVTASAVVTLVFTKDADSTTFTGSSTASLDGLWAYQIPSNLADGSYTVEVDSILNGADAQELEGDYHFTIDTTITAVTNTTFGVEGDITNTTTDAIAPIITGPGEVGDTVSITISGSTFTGIVGLDGTYQVALQGIPDDTYNYTVTTEDEAGNVAGYIAGGDDTQNNNATKQIIINRVVPETSLVLSQDSVELDNTVYDLTPTLQGQLTTDVAELSITLENAITGEQTKYVISVFDSDLNWSHTFDELAVGSAFFYTASIIGLVGEEFEENGFFRIRSPLEVDGLNDVTNSGSVEDEVTNDNTPTFEGTGLPGATVTLDIDEETYSETVNGDGDWSIDVTNALPEGSNNYTVTIVNSGNTISTQNGTVTIDTTLPSANWRVTDVDNDNKPEFTGLSTLPSGDVVTIMFDDGETVSTTVQPDGTWTVETGNEHVAGAIYDITFSGGISETHEDIIL